MTVYVLMHEDPDGDVLVGIYETMSVARAAGEHHAKFALRWSTVGGERAIAKLHGVTWYVDPYEVKREAWH